MRVFVTGASGHIGSALIPELPGNGHEVVGLARSDRSAAALEAAGAQVHRGDLDDLDGLHEAAKSADGVVHLAFKHEAMAAGDYVTAIADDLKAIEAMGAALDGTGKPFVGTGGTLMLAHGGITGRAGTEDDVLTSGPRVDAENTVTTGFADRGIRSSRHPPLADRAQLTRPPRLRPHPDRDRPRQGRGRLRRRRGQPLARRAHPGRRAAVPARA